MEKLKSFFERYSVLKYQEKDIVYRPDEMVEQVAFVKQGYVRLYNYDKSGREITYSGFKPIFLMSYFLAKKKTANKYFFQALTDLEIWKAPLDDFEKFLKLESQLVIDLTMLSLGSFNETLTAWENSISGDAYVRVGRLLLMLARDYGKVVDGKEVIEFKTTHQLIASMLGVSRETASIQIKRIENEGLIFQGEDAIVIENKEKMVEKFDI